MTRNQPQKSYGHAERSRIAAAAIQGPSPHPRACASLRSRQIRLKTRDRLIAPAQQGRDVRGSRDHRRQQGVADRRGATAAGAIGTAPAGQGLRAVRDRLRAVGPAAYRHVRRGVPHHAGAPGVRPPVATCRPSSTPSPTTWTACARCRTTCPNQAMVAEHLGRPLTAIPDPFGTHESYGAHMNARLRAFLDAVRLRLHLQERHRGLSQRARSTAPLLQGAGAPRRDPRGGPADPGAGAARHLQPDPADLAQDRPRAAGADRGVPARRRARSCSATRTAR